MTAPPDDRATGNPIITAFTYVRAVVFFPFAAAAVIMGTGAAMIAARLGRRDAVDTVIRTWARSIVGFLGLRVETEGFENLPALGRGAIFVFNHQSHLDIPSIHSVIPRTLRFGAKIELFKIPVFGAGMRTVGVLPIARADREEVFRVYREAAAKFREGYSFILAPEGTRQEEPRIGPFKKGPFVFAIESQVPIVPIVLKGTFDALPKGSRVVNAGRLTRTVKLRVLPAIETKGMGREDLNRLMEDVRERMVGAYEGM